MIKNKKHKSKISKEEVEIERDIEKGVNSKKTSKQDRKTLLEAAKNYRINLRINEGIVEDLKKESQRLGIPYQTLINSILYRYLSGGLVDLKIHEEVIKHLKKVS